MNLSNRFTQQFKCRVPIVLAPMAGASGGALAAAVARAGGFPFIAGGHAADLAALETEVCTFKQLAPPGTKWGLGLISYSALGINNALDEVLRRFRPDVIQFTAPPIFSDAVIPTCKAAGAQVFVTCNTLAEAKQAAAAGVDAVITQGSEAGGHSVRLELGRAAMPLAAAVVSELRGSGVHVLCAGGIMDGRGVVAALALGCDAVVMGTRFWACKESLGKPSIRQRLVEASGDDTVRTRVFDIVNTTVNEPYGWPPPYDSSRAVRNTFTEKWVGREEELEAELRAKGKESEVAREYQAALQRGDPQVAVCLTGEGVDLVRSIDSAEDVMERTIAEAMDVIASLNNLLGNHR